MSIWFQLYVLSAKNIWLPFFFLFTVFVESTTSAVFTVFVESTTSAVLVAWKQAHRLFLSAFGSAIIPSEGRSETGTLREDCFQGF